MQTINTTDILERVKEELSRVASRSYTQQEGSAPVSMYDSVMPTSIDMATLERHYRSALQEFITINYDICTSENTYEEKTEGEETVKVLKESGLALDLPDFSPSMLDEAIDAIIEYLTMSVCLRWIVEKNPAMLDEYTTKFNDSLIRANAILRTRRKPTRW